MERRCSRIAAFVINCHKVFLFFEKKIQFFKKQFWKKILKKIYFHFFFWNKTGKIIEKKVKQIFFRIFSRIVFEKLKKKFAELKCHTQLGNARVKVRGRAAVKINEWPECPMAEYPTGLEDLVNWLGIQFQFTWMPNAWIPN